MLEKHMCPSTRGENGKIFSVFRKTLPESAPSYFWKSRRWLIQKKSAQPTKKPD
jgi:hypothetical protein